MDSVRQQFIGEHRRQVGLVAISAARVAERRLVRRAAATAPVFWSIFVGSLCASDQDRAWLYRVKSGKGAHGYNAGAGDCDNRIDAGTPDSAKVTRNGCQGEMDIAKERGARYCQTFSVY